MIIETGNPDDFTCSISAAKVSKFLLDKLIKFGIYSIPFAPLSFAKLTNSSINVIYSGTMSAAIEAGIEGIPAIGFSLLDYRWNANFSDSKKFIKKITLNALKNKIPKDVVLNVNIPTLKESEIKGIKICRQAKSYWVEEFDKRKNPLGQEYYWLTGKFNDKDKGEDTDEWALKNGFISIVPVEFDLTAHSAIKVLNQWNFK